MLALDTAAAEGYLAALRELRDKFGLTDDISVMTVAQNIGLWLLLALMIYANGSDILGLFS